MSRRDEPALWRLFDATVRAEYERALTLAKQQIGPLPTTPGGRTALPLIDGDWRQAPAIEARMAGGYCLRAEAQDASPYANICEHCPGFRADPSHLAVLAAQRVDAQALAADADARGWSTEADRHCHASPISGRPPLRTRYTAANPLVMSLEPAGDSVLTAIQSGTRQFVAGHGSGRQ